MLIRSLAVAVATMAAALLVVAASFGGGSPSTPLKGTVGPGFTIKLTKSGKAVKSLRAGTYKITVADRSPEHNFVLGRQGGVQRQLTSVAFVGTKTVTVKLTKGLWKFYCAPHASGMFGRIAVGDSVLSRSVSTSTTTTTTVDDDDDDDRGRDEVEPGDDRGDHVEPGDDRGDHAEPGDDHGGNSGPGGGSDD